MCLYYLKLTFLDCSLNLCYLSFFLSLLRSLQICTVANEQGSVRGELGTTLTELATVQFTTRFSALETNVLGEQELQNRCV